MASLGMAVSDTTILRDVKKSVTAQTNRAAARIVGVDEWAWQKGITFGTVIVDLEGSGKNLIYQAASGRSVVALNRPSSTAARTVATQ